ncbi:MAG: S9 family peptidase [Anaerolineaceae bacterium]|nr:S9 family peptidase [Anaerolineaceae bacterium]
MTRQTRQFGTWTSPLSPKVLSGTLRLSDVQWDGASGALVWLEGRGAQGVLVMQQGTQAPCDLTSDLSVRAQVGYGGGDFTVFGGVAYFFGPGGRLYKQALTGGAARPITPAFGGGAAPCVSPDGKWVAFVHTDERVDGLAVVDADGAAWPRKLAYGTDFVMQPTWHPDGTYLAYIAWNHPQMPWDGTELRLLSLAYDGDGFPRVVETQTLTGDTTTAIFQPEFSPDGRWLAYVSDQSGMNQLYLYDLQNGTHIQITNADADHGAPAWVQGVRTYGWQRDSRTLVYIRSEKGFYTLWRQAIPGGKPVQVQGVSAFTHLGQIAVSPIEDVVAVIAASSTTPPRIISCALDDSPNLEMIHRRATSERIPPEQLSAAQPVTWKGHDGAEVHGLYYAPVSERFQGTGRPPLIVEAHGGPTGHRSATYADNVQFFTTRGYAVLQVNYRGSSGHGKAYMNMLRGAWGVYDVEDSASGAAYLVDQGLVDGDRLVIYGGSAGGFTVLQSLIDKPGFYKAGICMYGVSNQFALVTDTHKFEERYTDSLLGPLPESAALYRARSPLFHAEKIVDPIIVFQGEDDKVVPRNQSDTIVESLQARGVPHEYHVYPGEGHGWRKPETIEHFYSALLKFLSQHVLYS